MKTVKCAWCGLTLPLTKNTNTPRPQQHRDGSTTCGGSGQPVRAHEQIHAARLRHAAKAKED